MVVYRYENIYTVDDHKFRDRGRDALMELLECIDLSLEGHYLIFILSSIQFFLAS